MSLQCPKCYHIIRIDILRVDLLNVSSKALMPWKKDTRFAHTHALKLWKNRKIDTESFVIFLFFTYARSKIFPFSSVSIFFYTAFYFVFVLWCRPYVWYVFFFFFPLANFWVCTWCSCISIEMIKFGVVCDGVQSYVVGCMRWCVRLFWHDDESTPHKMRACK